MASALVMPGDVVGSAAEYYAGTGTYERDGAVRSSIVGTRTILPVGMNGKQATVAVVREGDVAPPVIEVGSVVLCKVARITAQAAFVDILVVDGRPLQQPFSGVIRKENVRDVEVDKVAIQDCFHPMDVVQAQVASLGDARSYYLSTAAPELGVVSARSLAGHRLVALSWAEMREEGEGGATEKRKVAKVDLPAR